MSEETVNQKVTDAITRNDEAPYGYCPVCGAKGVRREKRPNGDDQCALGHTYPSANAVASPRMYKMPRYTPPVNNQPCKCCGKDNAVSDFGLMCESCQRQSRLTINAEQLVTNLQKAADQDKEHVSNIREENERVWERNRQAQAEHDVRHWERLNAHQAKLDKQTADRDKVLGDLQDARLRKDELHRLFAVHLDKELELSGNVMASRAHLVDALIGAVQAQDFFEEEVAVRFRKETLNHVQGQLLDSLGVPKEHQTLENLKVPDSIVECEKMIRQMWAEVQERNEAINKIMTEMPERKEDKTNG